MEYLFGKRKTPNELVRENQRKLQRAIRDLDREKMRMEAQERKVVAEIKQAAKNNHKDSMRIMARDLVKTRAGIKKLVTMKANIQAVSTKMTTLKSESTMATAMKGVTGAMQAMNRQLNLPQMQQIMSDFERQSEMMDMKEEMIEDAIDNALGDEADDAESEQIVNQVLDELGIQMGEKMSGLVVPTGQIGAAPAERAGPSRVPIGAGGVPSGGGRAAAAATIDDLDDDLQRRLDALRQM